jgi:hypothetical protein
MYSQPKIEVIHTTISDQAQNRHVSLDRLKNKLLTNHSLIAKNNIYEYEYVKYNAGNKHINVTTL